MLKIPASGPGDPCGGRLLVVLRRSTPTATAAREKAPDARAKVARAVDERAVMSSADTMNQRRKTNECRKKGLTELTVLS